MAKRFAAFFRHGAYAQKTGVPSARQPWPLTQEGREQARQGGMVLSEMIAEHGLTIAPAIHCSHQLRAWQTAQELTLYLRELGHDAAKPLENAALAERGLGSAANLTVSEIETALEDDPRYDMPPPGWKSDSDYQLPLEGAESLMQAGRRVANYIDATAEPGAVTIYVGHGASFRHACHHFGILSREEIAQFSMFHAQPSLICHEAHDRWAHLAGAWKIRAARDDPKD